MFQTRNLLKTVTCVFLIAMLSCTDAALLSKSLNVSIQSENMRHILKWSSLQEACYSINYTVKYQGEFESMQDDSWQDEHSCYEIVQTECDLTLALSSDSDYNISVLARCDGSTVWTQLPNIFNRRDTMLLAPDMTVHPKVGQIEVNFSELQNHIRINLKIWKKGDEQNVFVQQITEKKFHYDVEGGEYCLTAEVMLDINNKTNSTEELCIRVQEREPSWLILLAVGVAVVLTLTMAVILGFLTLRCSLWLQKYTRNKVVLPEALLGWSEIPPMFPSDSLESTHSVSLIAPSQEHDRTKA